MKNAMKNNRPGRTRRGGGAGFTFIETLAAMLFMAIVIPVVVQALLLANRAGITADRQRTAGRLASMKLTELALTDDWRDGETEGDFGEDWPQYSWSVEDGGWEEDTMRVLSIEVRFNVQGRQRSVKLATLVLDAEAIEEEDEAQEDTGGAGQ